jgi:hypothetical protein
MAKAMQTATIASVPRTSPVTGLSFGLLPPPEELGCGVGR